MDDLKQYPSTSLNLLPGDASPSDVPPQTPQDTGVPHYQHHALNGRPFASPAPSDASTEPPSPIQGTLPQKGVKRQRKKKSNDLNNLKWKIAGNGDILYKSNGSAFKKASGEMESFLLQLNNSESKECDKGISGPAQSANRYHELVDIAESTVGIDLKLCDVTKLRRISTALRKVNFMTRQQIEEKEKVKFLWKKPPEDWPAEIEHFDPNNKGDFNHKPHKDRLLPMVIYLQEKYMEVRQYVLAQCQGRETQLSTGVQDTPMETDESVAATPAAFIGSSQSTHHMAGNSVFGVTPGYSTLPPSFVSTGGEQYLYFDTTGAPIDGSSGFNRAPGSTSMEGQQYTFVKAPGAPLEGSSGFGVRLSSTGGQQNLDVPGAEFYGYQALLSPDGNQNGVQQQSFDIQQNFQETFLTFKQGEEGLKKTPSMTLLPIAADSQDTQQLIYVNSGPLEKCEPEANVSSLEEIVSQLQQDYPEGFSKSREDFSQNQVSGIPQDAMMGDEDPFWNQGAPLPDFDNLAPMNELLE